MVDQNILNLVLHQKNKEERKETGEFKGQEKENTGKRNGNRKVQSGQTNFG